jgi:hypothetical protein
MNINELKALAERKQDPEVIKVAKAIGQFYLNKHDGDYDKAEDELVRLGISHIEMIENGVAIVLYRVGLLIGKKGDNIEALGKHLGLNVKIYEEAQPLISFLVPYDEEADAAEMEAEYWASVGHGSEELPSDEDDDWKPDPFAYDYRDDWDYDYRIRHIPPEPEEQGVQSTKCEHVKYFEKGPENKGPGWYWFDETGWANGPFKSEDEAIDVLGAYSRMYLNNL